VIHCLNDLQIVILFLEGKLDFWKKPTLEGIETISLGGSKGSPNNIMLFSARVGPVDHAASFPSCEGFFSWMATCLLTQSAARDA